MPTDSARENVVVCVRLRPLSLQELASEDEAVWETAARDAKLRLTIPDRAHGCTSDYAFDRVFAPTAETETIFSDVAQPLVDSAMRGMNVTLFAYGQTGSGKTYTMKGITRLAGDHIFSHIAATPNKRFLIKASAIEIYNEVVRDMLVDNGDALRVLDDPERGPVVEGLTETGVTSLSHLEGLLNGVETRRQVAATCLNEFSSRSHTIVRLYVECSDAQRPNSSGSGECEAGSQASESAVHPVEAVVVSTINFVDLAGSERSSIAGIQDGDERLRLKEGCHINRSLLTLGSVIRNLGDVTGKKHVPYRDSRLTRILQPSLSGNARMAIICTISPAASAVETTRAALHFATCAKCVQMRPRVNKVIDSKAQIRQLMEETSLLKKQLQAYKSGSTIEALNLELQKKDAQITDTLQSRDALQRRLSNLEKLVLRAHGGTPRKRRVSFGDASESDGSPFGSPISIDRPTLSDDTLLHTRSLDMKTARSGALHDGLRSSVGGSLGVGSALIDCWLPENVRHKLKRIDESKARSHPLALDDQSEASPAASEESGEDEAVDLSLALQDEMARLREISSNGPTSGHPSVEQGDVLSDEVILLEKLKTELKSQDTEKSKTAAIEALDALEGKINALAQIKQSPKASTEESNAFVSDAESAVGRRSRFNFEICFHNHLDSPSKSWSGGNTSLILRASASLGGTRRLSALDKPSVDRRQTSKPEFAEWLRSTQSNLKATIREDLSSLRECMKDYKKQVDRLECQKRILLEQVLRLEVRLDDALSRQKKAEEEKASLERDLAKERDGRRHLHQLAYLSPSPSGSPGSPCLSSDEGVEHDSWAAPPTAEAMLAKIVQLWEELNVSLRRRSRFFLTFRGGELFYYEAEQRRLLWEKSLLTETPEVKADTSEQKKAQKAYKRAVKRLENERKWLAAQMKFEFTEAERRSLFEQWSIQPDSKERKLQLVRRLWSTDTVKCARSLAQLAQNQDLGRTQQGMEQSAHLVLQLLGGEDLTTGALELVFRPPSHEDDPHIPVPYLISQLSRRFSRRSSWRSDATNEAYPQRNLM